MPAEAQVEEVESLKSIFFPEELQVSESCSGELQVLVWAPIEIPDNYQVKYFTSINAENPSYFQVKHVPPIHLKMTLPEDYPHSKPPRFALRCEWLSNCHLNRLARGLNNLWRQNKYSAIIYIWIEYLKSDALSAIGMNLELDITFLSLEHLRYTAQKNGSKLSGRSDGNNLANQSSARGQEGRSQVRKVANSATYGSKNVVQILESFDKEQRKTEFLKDWHKCEICFSDKSGGESMLFERCGHIFCRECLRLYFTVLINDGMASGMKCPAFKCDTEVSQPQMRELLPQETFEKYDKALLSAMLDTMSDIVYCPRVLCQYPVTWEPEERVAVCPMCRFAFCIYCKMVYHGVEPCRFTAEERRRLVEEYNRATPEEKAEFEKRYGKKQLTNLVDNTLAECWIKENSKNCPNCHSSIEKSEGCNKMTCVRCQAFFCWLCETKLDPSEPYVHFRDPKSPCNDKLFYPLHGEEDDLDWEIFIHDDEDSGESDMEGEDTGTDD